MYERTIGISFPAVKVINNHHHLAFEILVEHRCSTAGGDSCLYLPLFDRIHRNLNNANNSKLLRPFKAVGMR